jgi:hypothetical protein
VDERLEKLQMRRVNLPLGATDADQHVPIYVSPDIEQKKRVIILFGERNQDPQIFSYRVIGDEGINRGSVVDTVDAILNKKPLFNSDEQPPGLIITNPSQLYWYRQGARAVSWVEWLGLPRESAVHQPLQINPDKNTVPENLDFREHVNYIFDKVVTSMLHKDVKLDIIGLEWTGTAVLEYFCKNCKMLNSI